MRHTVFAAVVLLVQLLCTVFFVGQIVVGMFGLSANPMEWEFVELIQIGASVGLMLGVVLGAVMLVRSLRRARGAEDKLRELSVGFRDLMEQRFADWGLTPAERDVALFAIKGLSTADIARMRQTSEGTVKAQTAAIYRKAGVTGRPQLLSLFIDDILMGEVTPSLSVVERDQSAA